MNSEDYNTTRLLRELIEDQSAKIKEMALIIKEQEKQLANTPVVRWKKLEKEVKGMGIGVAFNNAIVGE